MNYIGIDLGTSAVKLLLVSEKGNVRKTVSREYPLEMPNPGWSQQNPQDWWLAVQDGLNELLEGIDTSSVAGIGCAGQMHGLVCLDAKGKVIRPCILWNDGRTQRQVEYLNEQIGKDLLLEQTGNFAFAGFTAPKLLWLQENEPEAFEQIAHIMLPKDYIVYKLTGKFSTDYSDAAGTLLLDVENKVWSKKMLELCHVQEEWLPDLYESDEVVGTIKPEIACEFALKPDVFVIAGAGDNAAAAIGCNVIEDSTCNLSLGTSGTLFVSASNYPRSSQREIHCFNHASGSWHLLGCILSAASCNAWWMQHILSTDEYAREQARITEDRLGRNTVFFLPYLMGERSPYNDPAARGAFIGLTLNTGREDMLQAVLEGVAFAFKDCMEIARQQGITIRSASVCGGGSKSGLWLNILANVLDCELLIPETDQGPGFGAAILAMHKKEGWNSLSECASDLVKIKETIVPDDAIAARYVQKYRHFHQLYPALKGKFTEE